MCLRLIFTPLMARIYDYTYSNLPSCWNVPINMLYEDTLLSYEMAELSKKLKILVHIRY